MTIAPMLAKAVEQIPEGDFAYEPKWDGFRAIISRDGGGVEIGSRGEKLLTRYFPELVEQFERQLPEGLVVDGEIVVPMTSAEGIGRLDFSALQQRIHPAQSRVELLSRSTPASFVAFDLIAIDGRSLMGESFRVRRRLLEEAASSWVAPLHLTALTTDPMQARQWFESFEGAGLDGIVAKAWDLTYQPDVRAMLKVKHHRTADCVVAGFRRHKGDNKAVGALLLGLHDDRGRLHYVGSTSSFSMAIRREMAEILQPMIVTEGHPWIEEGDEDLRRPGAISRWSAKKDRGFEALDPVLVCEVRYDQLEGDRFRHTTTFLRWRPDRRAGECRYDQLEIPARYDLASVMR
jgi:ATP-dependent DNA ligase